MTIPNWFDTTEVQEILNKLRADQFTWSAERITDWNPCDNGKSGRVVYSGELIDRLREIRTDQIDVALDFADLTGDDSYAKELMSQPDVDDWLSSELV